MTVGGKRAEDALMMPIALSAAGSTICTAAYAVSFAKSLWAAIKPFGSFWGDETDSRNIQLWNLLPGGRGSRTSLAFRSRQARLLLRRRRHNDSGVARLAATQQ
jgi:hypothetical protein